MSGTIHRPGDQIASRYEILYFLGAGGMQEVYKAKDITLEREVALKAPKTQAAERRFRRSAVLSAKVNHPNAAKTLDYLEVGARQYLVEEFIDGQDLSKVRDRFFSMDPYLVAHVMHHLAKGIAASHHVGVVHRDLKPSNIMVSHGVGIDVVKITDFGIAKMTEVELTEAVAGGEETITGSHTMMGALPYLAPEMINSPKTAGPPSDIWAVGAMMYELLCGEKPFGKGLMAVPNIINGATPSLPRAATRNPQFKGLSEEVYEVIQQCLSKDPASRPEADDLVLLCEKLCYPFNERIEGIVASIRYKSWGFIEGNSETVFFNLASVYGETPGAGDSVCFAKYPGEPRERAHPVVKLRPTEP